MLTKNKSKTLQVRLTEDDYEYLTEASYMMGTTPSAYVRQLVQMAINAAKIAKKSIEENRVMMASDLSVASNVNLNEDN